MLPMQANAQAAATAAKAQGAQEAAITLAGQSIIQEVQSHDAGRVEAGA